MGVGGMLEYFSEKLVKKKKKKLFNRSVSVKIRMDCQGCALKVKKSLSRVKGAESVDVDLKQQKATVHGEVDAKKVMEAARSTGKKIEPWPYVPYTTIAHPYVPRVYDKKAPPNFVQATNDSGVVALEPLEEQYTLMFNDENTNACSIM